MLASTLPLRGQHLCVGSEKTPATHAVLLPHGHNESLRLVVAE
jgi:hypothetical protein